MNTCRFIVDFNVGRLARWLRIMGHDVLFVPESEDAELVRLAQREGRAIITRDKLVMRRRAIASGRLSALLIRSERLDEQLRQVVEAYGLDAAEVSRVAWSATSPLQAVEREAAYGKSARRTCSRRMRRSWSALAVAGCSGAARTGATWSGACNGGR